MRVPRCDEEAKPGTGEFDVKLNGRFAPRDPGRLGDLRAGPRRSAEGARRSRLPIRHLRISEVCFDRMTSAIALTTAAPSGAAGSSAFLYLSAFDWAVEPAYVAVGEHERVKRLAWNNSIWHPARIACQAGEESLRSSPLKSGSHQLRNRRRQLRSVADDDFGSMVAPIPLPVPRHPRSESHRRGTINRPAECDSSSAGREHFETYHPRIAAHSEFTSRFRRPGTAGFEIRHLRCDRAAPVEYPSSTDRTRCPDFARVPSSAMRSSLPLPTPP